MNFSDLYGDLAVKFYLIGNILDADYLADYNQLSYENLCLRVGKPDTSCNIFYGENYVLFNVYSGSECCIVAVLQRHQGQVPRNQRLPQRQYF